MIYVTHLAQCQKRRTFQTTLIRGDDDDDDEGGGDNDDGGNYDVCFKC